MATLAIRLPSQKEQADLNLRRWEQLIVDPGLAKIEGRVEMDRYGQTRFESDYISLSWQLSGGNWPSDVFLAETRRSNYWMPNLHC